MPFPDALNPKRKNGGADQFLKFIENRVKPAAEKLAPLNKSGQTLWGHSYGGLFVLYVLSSSPDSFQSYASADPSLWWNGGAMFAASAAFASSGHEFTGASLLMMKSGQESRARQFDEEKREAYEARVRAVSSVPADAAKTAAYRFASLKGISVQYREYPQLSHGPLVPVSFYAALRLAQGYAD